MAINITQTPLSPDGQDDGAQPAEPGAGNPIPGLLNHAAPNDAALAMTAQAAPTPPQWVWWSDQWPTATGPIALEIVSTHLGSFEDQRKVAQVYFDLFSDADPDLCDINGDGALLACILSIPETCDI